MDPWGLCVEVGYRPIDPFNLIYHTFLRVTVKGEAPEEWEFDALAPGAGVYSFLYGAPVPGIVKPVLEKGFYKTISTDTEKAEKLLENIEKYKWYWFIYSPLNNCYHWRNTMLMISGIDIPNDNPWSPLR